MYAALGRGMKKPSRKKKPKHRLPLEAVMKLRSHPVSTKKGRKGSDRKLKKEINRKTIKEELFIENSDKDSVTPK